MAILICDLDGTLVDSFPGISAAMQTACDKVGVKPATVINRSLVGPALDDILRIVAGTTDSGVVQRLRQAFVDAYDGGACMLSPPFVGIRQMLTLVRQRGHRLALATNKRLLPTERIIEALGWSEVFELVETVDSRCGPNRTKSQMLEDVCRSARCDPQSGFYLGDMEADVHAARIARTRSIVAAWGAPRVFGAVDLVAETPVAVVALLERNA